MLATTVCHHVSSTYTVPPANRQQPFSLLPVQVYAPVDDNPAAFHRTVSLFISPDGDKLAQAGTGGAGRQAAFSNFAYCCLPACCCVAFRPLHPPNCCWCGRCSSPARKTACSARAALPAATGQQVLPARPSQEDGCAPAPAARSAPGCWEFVPFQILAALQGIRCVWRAEPVRRAWVAGSVLHADA
jgi:hypothetical protein